MQFQVPQYIDIEDKILGPLTVRQFLLALSFAAVAIFVFVAFDDTIDRNLGLLAIIATGIAFVFAKPLDMRFENFALVWIAFQLKSKQRIWFKVKQKVITIRDQQKGDLMEELVDKKGLISKTKISSLTEILDSGGRSSLEYGKAKKEEKLKNDFELDYANSYTKSTNYSSSGIYYDYISEMSQNIDPGERPNLENAFKSTLIVPEKAVYALPEDEKNYMSEIEAGVTELYNDSPLSGFYENKSDEADVKQESKVEDKSKPEAETIPEEVILENMESVSPEMENFVDSKSFSVTPQDEHLVMQENTALPNTFPEISPEKTVQTDLPQNASPLQRDTFPAQIKNSDERQNSDNKNQAAKTLSVEGDLQQGQEIDLSNLFNQNSNGKS